MSKLPMILWATGVLFGCVALGAFLLDRSDTLTWIAFSIACSMAAGCAPERD